MDRVMIAVSDCGVRKEIDGDVGGSGDRDNKVNISFLLYVMGNALYALLIWMADTNHWH